jgi:hypothetical protein
MRLLESENNNESAVAIVVKLLTSIVGRTRDQLKIDLCHQPLQSSLMQAAIQLCYCESTAFEMRQYCGVLIAELTELLFADRAAAVICEMLNGTYPDCTAWQQQPLSALVICRGLLSVGTDAILFQSLPNGYLMDFI